MRSPTSKASHAVLRNLPSVDELLRSPTGLQIVREAGTAHAALLIRRVIENIRTELGEAQDADHTKVSMTASVENELRIAYRKELSASVKRVINATGVVIHTNLGRAPLSEDARRAMFEQVAGYCSLEYDIETGKRGKRGRLAEDMICELTGAEGALIVNNCAAAAFFVLTVFASGGEVVISRGELVEIGGDFRVPDVLAQSAATLREVGTTNRTKLVDYEKAVNEKTRLILRVHPSNYKIVGFTATPTVSELAELAHKHGMVFYEDIGSGSLTDLTRYGLSDEPVVGASLAAGADIVTFSGDKLLGGPQAGIIAGSTELIERLRRHPLYRSLRVDKIVYAALEATLASHRRGSEFTDIPVLRMISLTKDEIAARSSRFVESLSIEINANSGLRFEILDGISATGGGAAPTARMETALIALRHDKMSASKVEYFLRKSDPPVITRIVGDRVMIDLRTVSESEESGLAAALTQIA